MNCFFSTPQTLLIPWSIRMRVDAECIVLCCEQFCCVVDTLERLGCLCISRWFRWDSSSWDKIELLLLVQFIVNAPLHSPNGNELPANAANRVMAIQVTFPPIPAGQKTLYGSKMCWTRNLNSSLLGFALCYWKFVLIILFFLIWGQTTANK